MFMKHFSLLITFILFFGSCQLEDKSGYLESPKSQPAGLIDNAINYNEYLLTLSNKDEDTRGIGNFFSKLKNAVIADVKGFFEGVSDPSQYENVSNIDIILAEDGIPFNAFLNGIDISMSRSSEVWSSYQTSVTYSSTTTEDIVNVVDHIINQIYDNPSCLNMVSTLPLHIPSQYMNIGSLAGKMHNYALTFFTDSIYYNSHRHLCENSIVSPSNRNAILQILSHDQTYLDYPITKIDSLYAQFAISISLSNGNTTGIETIISYYTDLLSNDSTITNQDKANFYCAMSIAAYSYDFWYNHFLAISQNPYESK